MIVSVQQETPKDLIRLDLLGCLVCPLVGGYLGVEHAQIPTSYAGAPRVEECQALRLSSRLCSATARFGIIIWRHRTNGACAQGEASSKREVWARSKHIST